MTSKKMLGVEELTEYLGVSVNTVYFWVSLRKIPHYKIGKYLKFNADEIEIWLKERKVEPISL